MTKHRAQNSNVARNAVAMVAAGAGIVALSPAVADAATITVPSTDVAVDAPDHVAKQVQPHIDRAYQQAADLGVVNQDAKPSAHKTAPKKSSAPKAKSVGQRIADIAKSKVGAPYAWGATGPGAFDCSGLTSWAYQQVGKAIPRTSQGQANGGQQVPLNALQPGDIVSYYGGQSHVAIYIGNGKVVQALNSSSPVRVDDLHYMPVNNATRF